MNTTSTELREWAARCEHMIVSARTEKERESLLRKAEGLRALADSEDWLAGHSSDDVASKADKAEFGIKSLAAE